MPKNPRPLTLQGLSRLLRDHIAATDRALQRVSHLQEETEGRVEALRAHQEAAGRAVEGLARHQEATERAVQGLAGRQEETERRLQSLVERQESTHQRLQEMTGGIQVLSGIVRDLARTVARHDEELVACRDDIRRALHSLEQQGARLEEHGRLLQQLMEHLRGRGGDGGAPPPTA